MYEVQVLHLNMIIYYAYIHIAMCKLLAFTHSTNVSYMRWLCHRLSPDRVYIFNYMSACYTKTANRFHISSFKERLPEYLFSI